MSKKILFTLVIVIVSIFTLATTFSFAANDNNPVNDVVDGARNMVNNAENTVEGAVKNMGETMKDSANKTGDSVNNAADNVKNTMDRNDDQNYTANRTNTATTRAARNDSAGTFLGMNSTTWTWVVLAIAAVAIVALVWYYSNQITNNRRYDDGE